MGFAEYETALELLSDFNKDMAARGHPLMLRRGLLLFFVTFAVASMSGYRSPQNYYVQADYTEQSTRSLRRRTPLL